MWLRQWLKCLLWNYLVGMSQFAATNTCYTALCQALGGRKEGGEFAPEYILQREPHLSYYVDTTAVKAMMKRGSSKIGAHVEEVIKGVSFCVSGLPPRHTSRISSTSPARSFEVRNSICFPLKTVSKAKISETRSPPQKYQMVHELVIIWNFP